MKQLKIINKSKLNYFKMKIMFKVIFSVNSIPLLNKTIILILIINKLINKSWSLILMENEMEINWRCNNWKMWLR